MFVFLKDLIEEWESEKPVNEISFGAIKKVKEASEAMKKFYANDELIIYVDSMEEYRFLFILTALGTTEAQMRFIYLKMLSIGLHPEWSENDIDFAFLNQSAL